jgi:hypothetical protein
VSVRICAFGRTPLYIKNPFRKETGANRRILIIEAVCGTTIYFSFCLLMNANAPWTHLTSTTEANKHL